MVSMDSCLALSMNPQVLMITIDASSFVDSCSTSNLLAFNCAINTSESKVFLAQPSVTTLTLFLRSVLVFISGILFKCSFYYRKQGAKLRQKLGTLKDWYKTCL